MEQVAPARGVLGDWVDVDNQLARIAPVLAEFGIRLRFMRDSGRAPRLAVVNPSTGPEYSVRAELTAVRLDGPYWGFMYHATPEGLPLLLGADVFAVAARTAYLLGIDPGQTRGGHFAGP
jgi:hypothetical protein